MTTLRYYEYTTADGDRWDLIAYRYYNDPNRMDEIIKANPEVLLYTVLPAGLKLRIPALTVEQTVSIGGSLPPWKS
ncbi:MAG TPA: tail protein X [bacterium]|nr:tail protein X [bacterium]